MNFLILLIIGFNLVQTAPINESTEEFHDVIVGNIIDLENNESINDGHYEKNDGVEIHLVSWRWEEFKSYILIAVFLLIAAGVKILYHQSHVLSTHVPESCVLIILGTLVGLIFHYLDLKDNAMVPKFTSDLFFCILLPPIILESAYSLYDKSFFNNIGTILLYAVIGTVMNVFTIGPTLYLCNILGFFGDLTLPLIECIIFATLISAVDPVAVLAIFQEVNVNKALYFLVFGESLLNDAVVITLYNTVTAFAESPGGNITISQILMGFASFLTVCGGGVLTGFILGVFSSVITLFTTHVTVVEPLIVIVIAYMSYIGAELFHFSGIISLIVCGLMQWEYTRHNISKKSYTTIKYLTKTLSSIADVIIFLFLGMVLIKDNHAWNTSFVLSTTLFCVIYRFMSVFCLTFFANRFFQRLRIVNFQEQLIMAYGGLRGAIAFSLAIMLNSKYIKNADLFVTATLFVILFTVFVLGSTTKPIVRLLEVKQQEKHEAKLFIEINNKVFETVMAGIEEVAGHRSGNYWSQKFARFNDSYIKAILITGGAENAHGIKNTYEKMYKTHRSIKRARRGDSQEKGKHTQLSERGSGSIITNELKPLAENETSIVIENVMKSCDDINETPKTNDETRKVLVRERNRPGSWIRRRQWSMPTKVSPPSPKIERSKVTSTIEPIDYSRALADAFSRSAYYQNPGGIQCVEDREYQISKEHARTSKWLSARSMLPLATIVAANNNSTGGGLGNNSTVDGKPSLQLHSVVRAAKAMAAAKQAAAKQESAMKEDIEKSDR